MKYQQLVFLAAAASSASAHVLPEASVFANIPVRSRQEQQQSSLALNDGIQFVKKVSGLLKDRVEQAVDETRSVLDRAFAAVQESRWDTGSDFENAYADGWLEENAQATELVGDDGEEAERHSPHDPDHPHHPDHHRRHHHPCHKSNKTIYELISESKYTTKLAKLIADDDKLVKVLNSTSANYTVFAPTDEAFEKLPHHHKPSKEEIREVILYHVAPGLYPAPRILGAHTLATLLKEDELRSPEPAPQRLKIFVGLHGLAVNFMSRVVAANIFASNGVIHGVNRIILPPPHVLKTIELVPGEFSTLELALRKTDLLDTLKHAPHNGSTFFAPSNFAFKMLGPKINAFLFSSYGQKYLTALLKYHVVLNETLYSNAYYRSDAESEDCPHDRKDCPRNIHVDLPTLLEGKDLSIDIARFGPFISLRINGFSCVSLADVVAKDGVVHVLSEVLIPPKRPGSDATASEASASSSEMSVEELIERLEPFVGNGHVDL